MVKKLTKAEIEEFFAILEADNPNPKGELDYINPYTLLVAVTLSAQATDKGVNKATEGLFKIVKTPQDMLNLGIDNLIKHIRTIGLYNAKAKNLMAMAQILVDDFNGEVPNNRDDLVKLPGVGRKTANVVLNIAFNEPTMAVDTHIFRVSNRTGLAPGKNVDIVEQELLKRVPAQYMLHAHHWLILLGRYICKARTPLCSQCKVKHVCHYDQKIV
ncbi:MAG: endonuclease III [Alphaproteobacteria bacterium]